ncbi:hypothetical protein VTL71DRAFT_11490 [Oculimacula yallundae]|uniref:Uncharacterized protein n=1 Tax=Oculimacula yallundae TaxID=86028 RepID=A0ABR4CQW5_9HELO
MHEAIFPMASRIVSVTGDYYSIGLVESRIVEVFYSRSAREGNLTTFPIHKTNARLPPILTICRDTTARALKELPWCALDENTTHSDGSAKQAIMFNPLSDAIYLRYEVASYLGHNTVRHLIVEDSIDTRQLAKYVHLEELTLVLHNRYKGHGNLCMGRKMGPAKHRPALEFRRPKSAELEHCKAAAYK